MLFKNTANQSSAVSFISGIGVSAIFETNVNKTAAADVGINASRFRFVSSAEDLFKKKVVAEEDSAEVAQLPVRSLSCPTFPIFRNFFSPEMKQQAAMIFKMGNFLLFRRRVNQLSIYRKQRIEIKIFKATHRSSRCFSFSSSSSSSWSQSGKKKKKYSNESRGP